MNPVYLPNTLAGWLRPLVFGLVTAALVAITAPARADGDPRTDQVPRIMPYEGRLELDGRPLDAHGEDAIFILFSLYDGADAERPVYSQPMRVDVYDGDFTSTIGPTGVDADGAERAIADVIATGDDLYLGLTLLGDPEDPADDVPLAQRQPIRATPYALWTTSATDIGIADEAQIGGDVTVGGALVALAGLRVSGDVQLSNGAIDSAEIRDRNLEAADLDGDMLGNGIQRGGGRLRLDAGLVDSSTRNYTRSNCHLRLGWRNECSNCDQAPAKHVTVRADGRCTGASGADTRCRSNNDWGGVNIDGEASDDDVFYIRMICN